MSLCHTPCHQLHSNPPITSVPLSSLVCYGAKTARDPLVLPDCASCNMEKQLGPTASLYSASLFLWSSARIHTHTHTYAQTLPLLCSNSGSIATHKCTRTGSEGTQRKKKLRPKPKPGGERTQKKKTTRALRRRKEYLALPSGVRGLEEKKSNREGQREHLRTTAHQYYSCIVIMHALSWRQTMAITLKRKKLSRAHLKAFCRNRRMTNNKESTSAWEC